MFASKDAFFTNNSGGYTIGKSVRLRSSASAYFNRTPSVAGNRKIWTWSGWVKRGTLGTNQIPFGSTGGGSSQGGIRLIGDYIDVYEFNGTSDVYYVDTTPVYRDPSAWYHIVVAMDTTQATSTNRVKIWVNGVQVTSFRTSVYPTLNYDTYVNSTNPAGIGSNYTGSWGQFFDGYLTEINFIDGQALTPSSFGSTNAITGVWQPAKYTGTYGTNGFYLNFSDNSAATPATLGKDSSGATSNVIVGSSTNASTTLTVVSISGISVGNIVNGPGIPSNTYVTAIGVLQVTLSQAATSTNASQNYTFSGNNWTPNNISVTAGVTYDSMVDSPTVSAVSSNWCVMNPLDMNSSSITVSDGNLNVTGLGAASVREIRATMGVNSGKWYYEATAQSSGSFTIGITKSSNSTSLDWAVGVGAGNTYVYYGGNGNKFNGSSGSSYGASFTSGDVIGVAFDLTSGSITFYKNNSSQGVAYTWTPDGSYWSPSVEGDSASVTAGAIFNFGQRPFSFSPPSGYLALNTFNLP